MALMQTLMVALAFGSLADAPPKPAAEQTAPPRSWSASGGFIAISAADAPSLARWYREMLGFETLSEGQNPEQTIRFALLRKDQSLVEILQRPGVGAPPRDAAGAREAWRVPGYFKFGLFVSDLDALDAALAARGVTFNHRIVKPTANPWRTFAVRDPEGNIVQFFGQ